MVLVPAAATCPMATNPSAGLAERSTAKLALFCSVAVVQLISAVPAPARRRTPKLVSTTGSGPVGVTMLSEPFELSVKA